MKLSHHRSNLAPADSRTVEEMRLSIAKCGTEVFSRLACHLSPLGAQWVVMGARSRPSFFGGTVSTRLRSAAPGWQPPAPPMEEADAPKGHMRGAVPARHAGISHQQCRQQQDRQRMARDFSSLDDDDQTPAATQRMPKTVWHLAKVPVFKMEAAHV